MFLLCFMRINVFINTFVTFSDGDLTKLYKLFTVPYIIIIIHI